MSPVAEMRRGFSLTAGVARIVQGSYAPKKRPIRRIRETQRARVRFAYMSKFMFRFRDRKNTVVLDRPAQSLTTTEALCEAGGSLRSIVNKHRHVIDPRGRLEVEDSAGRVVGRLLLIEELQTS